jgi:hypothetical protein
MIIRACTIFAAAAMAGTLGYMVGDNQVPFVQQWAEEAPPNPVEGQEIVITWHGVRYRQCPGTVKRTIVDYCKEVHYLESVSALYSPVDTEATFSRSFRIPAHIAHGPAVYQAQTDFVCNPLQRWWPIVSVGVPVKLYIGDPSDIKHCGPTDPKLP